jgi:hypothetical protein
MEIFDLLHLDGPSFEDDYRRMVKSESRLESLMGSMFLDLLDALHCGPLCPAIVTTIPMIAAPPLCV